MKLELAQRKLQLDNLQSFYELGYDPFTYLKYLPPNIKCLKVDRQSCHCCHCSSQKYSSSTSCSSSSDNAHCCCGKWKDDINAAEQRLDVSARWELPAILTNHSCRLSVDSASNTDNDNGLLEYHFLWLTKFWRLATKNGYNMLLNTCRFCVLIFLFVRHLSDHLWSKPNDRRCK